MLWWVGTVCALYFCSHHSSPSTLYFPQVFPTWEFSLARFSPMYSCVSEVWLLISLFSNLNRKSFNLQTGMSVDSSGSNLWNTPVILVSENESTLFQVTVKSWNLEPPGWKCWAQVAVLSWRGKMQFDFGWICNEREMQFVQVENNSGNHNKKEMGRDLKVICRMTYLWSHLSLECLNCVEIGW